MYVRALVATAALVATSWPSALNAAEPAASARQGIELTTAEQDYLIAEMHANVAALQSLLDALARSDRPSAEQAAATRGTASFHSRDGIRPKTLAAKFPPPWKTMAEGLREAFDQLAASIAAGASTEDSLHRASQLLAICSSCHSSYRFVASP